MRLYIQNETDKAYQLESLSFKKRWVSKKAVTIDFDTLIEGGLLNGKSYEMRIEKWALK